MEITHNTADAFDGCFQVDLHAALSHLLGFGFQQGRSLDVCWSYLIQQVELSAQTALGQDGSMKWMFDEGKVVWQWDLAIHEYHRELYGTSRFNKKRFLKFYKEYENDLFDYFSGRESDFLVIPIESGFNIPLLCEFLEIEIPDVQLNVPKLNERKSIDKVTTSQKLMYEAQIAYIRLRCWLRSV